MGTRTGQTPTGAHARGRLPPPHLPQDHALDGRVQNAAETVSDEDMARALSTVCLTDLLPRMGGFHAVCDWSAVLSAGEQQRLSIARLLLRLPQPKAAFMDEATSALDPATEAAVYGAISRGKYTYVSVGHRASLLKYHTWLLIASGNGQWELHRTADPASRSKLADAVGVQ